MFQRERERCNVTPRCKENNNSEEMTERVRRRVSVYTSVRKKETRTKLKNRKCNNHIIMQYKVNINSVVKN